MEDRSEPAPAPTLPSSPVPGHRVDWTPIYVLLVGLPALTALFEWTIRDAQVRWLYGFGFALPWPLGYLPFPSLITAICLYSAWWLPLQSVSVDSVGVTLQWRSRSRRVPWEYWRPPARKVTAHLHVMDYQPKGAHYVFTVELTNEQARLITAGRPPAAAA